MNTKMTNSKMILHRVNDRAQGLAAESLAGAFETIERLSRRRFMSRSLGALGAALVAGIGGQRVFGAEAPRTSSKAVKTGQFIFPRLKFAVKDETLARWNSDPGADVILRRQLASLTNINVSQEAKVVTLADFDDMCKNPFVFMTSEGYFDLSATEQKNMREFLERGGFIHADDCVYYGADRFFQQYKFWMSKMFPDNPMRKIPYDHEIFHIYYDFKEGSPHMQGVPHGAYGLFEPGTGRIMTVCTPGDLHCGWACAHWPMEKNMEAIKMGVNIIIYFLSH